MGDQDSGAWIALLFIGVLLVGLLCYLAKLMNAKPLGYRGETESEKPSEKRLVSKTRYVRAMGMKLGLRTTAMFALALACLAGALALTCGVFGLDSIFQDEITGLGISLVCLLFAWKSYRWSKSLFAKDKAIEQGEPITSHNTHLLPAEQTLLRGSEIPSTVAQSELLRATETDSETPKEELLRPTEIQRPS